MSRDNIYYVGIDPGSEGGVAVLHCGEIETDFQLQATPLAIFTRLQQFFDGMRKDGLEFRVCVERVGGFMKGSRGNIGSAMFNFGVTYGSILTSLYALDVLGFLNPTPTMWQNKVGAPKGEGDKEQHKRDLRDYAKQIFPNASPTLKTGDAMLIAYYASLF